MTNFRVWAPFAQEVEFCTNDSSYKMEKESHGWWKYVLKNPDQKVLYSFKVDGKGPFPDPRSRFQPNGVHRSSQLCQDNFSWTDNSWETPLLKEAIIYEIHTGTFSDEGNFHGIEKRLDYLKKLGVTHIELMPVAAFPGKHGWGYDGVSLFAPFKGYGNPNSLKQLVDSCHQKGIATILDVVYNHLGPDGNYLEQFAPYFSSKYGTPWGKAVNFDDKMSNQVRDFFINNALMWLEEFHFDCLRIDAVHAIFDFSAKHFLEELSCRVRELEKRIGRRKYLIAESDLNDPRIIRPSAACGYGIAGQWLDDFHHSIHVMLTNEKNGYYIDYDGLESLKKCFEEYYVFNGQYSDYRKRNHGRKATGLKANQFVVFTQNHDQVGNRALGERLCHLVNQNKCEIAAALLFLSPFIPMIFQGEEWAASTPFLYFTDHENPELGKAVTNGRRKEFSAFGYAPKEIPDPQDTKTFNMSRLKWEEIRLSKHSKMLDWYKQLIRIRKKFFNEIESKQRSFRILDQENQLFMWQSGKLILLINCGNREVSFTNSLLQKAATILENNDFQQENCKITLKPATVILKVLK